MHPQSLVVPWVYECISSIALSDFIMLNDSYLVEDYLLDYLLDYLINAHGRNTYTRAVMYL